MLLRYGFYKGYVAGDDRAEFNAMIERQMIPGLAEMPGVASVRLMRGVPVGGLAPRYYHAIELAFRDQEDLLMAMNSEQRREIARIPAATLGLFKGHTPHGNFELIQSLRGTSAPGPADHPR